MRPTSSYRSILIVIAAALIPAVVVAGARAATPVPAATVVATSVDSGWSSNPAALAIRYNEPIDISASSPTAITVTDGVAAAVPGTVSYVSNNKQPDDTALLWTAAAPLVVANGPYTVTFTGHAVNQATGTTDPVTTKKFSIDAAAPPAPAAATLTTSSGAPVAGPSDTVELSGSASDLAGTTIGTSGIASVELRLYSPALLAQNPGQIGAVLQDPNRLGAMYIAPAAPASAGCTGQCPTAFSYDFKNIAVPPGVWAARVTAIDLAGNRSPESDATTFVVVSAPAP